MDRDKKKRYQKRFSAIEASFRIEGMDPIEDPVFRRAKAMLLTGAMAPKQALEYVVERSEAYRRKVAATA